jgi:hypothetical protein
LKVRVEILNTDKWFTESPDCGQPNCLCSRCGQVIKEEDCPPLRLFIHDAGAEYRFHLSCVTQTVIEETT